MVYITVRYGESQREIFNPNCKTNVLLKSIKTKCKCDREADIELSDESETDSDNPHILYKPLLQTDDGVLSDEFLARLAVKGNETQQKRVRSSTRRRDKPSVAESSKDHSRQNSREKNNDKLKTGSKSDKRLSARSKR
ncbi:hypothetical protein MAR_025629 [Mya arenaria]|uniref:Uncharacterized protein n=1 Tax=Mya arenaria TaxID=6604 RepID=A0ABY7ESS1_MYAAR|nr:hypothetical protein MAR_025629 [Mya arenaria]